MSAPSRTRVRVPALPPADHEGLARFLRSVHPYDTAGRVSDDTGAPVATVRNWLQGRNRVSVDGLLHLLTAYGPDVLIALWPGQVPVWMDDQAVARAEADLAAQSAALAARKADIEARR